MIALMGVRKSYGKSNEFPALPAIDLVADRGRIVWLSGPSGSGKSTLLGIIGQLVVPDAGDVFIDGNLVGSSAEFSPSVLRRTMFGFVPQQPRLFPELSVEQNISLAGARVQRRAIRSALATVGLGQLGSRAVNTLSGGQQQRVSLARALVKQPMVLLADEPSSGLDDINASAVFTALREFADLGRCVIVASHDSRIAPFVDDRITLGGVLEK